MTIILAVPIISNALPDAEVMVIPGFGIMLSPWRSQHFFELRDTATPMSKYNLLKVNTLVFDIAEMAIPI